VKLPAVLILAGFLAACGSSTIAGSSVKSVRANPGSNAVQVSTGGASNAAEVTRLNPPAQKANQRPVAPVVVPAPAPRTHVLPGAGDRCGVATGGGKAQPLCLVE
jgi:hypothetical protein